MNWYEAIPSLTPLAAYDALSHIYYDKYIKYISSRLSDSPDHWHGLPIDVLYKEGNPYKYLRISDNYIYTETGSKLKGRVDLGENWLIYYSINNALDNFGLYSDIESNDAYKMAAGFYNKKEFRYGNVYNSPLETISIAGSNLNSLGPDDLYDVAIQRSTNPSKSFLYIKGDTYPLEANLLPQKIEALLSPVIIFGGYHRISNGFAIAAMGAFAGNTEPAEIVKISDALKENLRALPDLTVNVLDGIVSVGSGEKVERSEPHVDVIGDIERVGSGEKVERSEPHVDVIGDIERVNIFAGYDFQYGVIEGSVHEVFPPNPQAPVSRRVICIEQPSNRVVKETWSREEDGYYIFTALNKNKKHTVLAYDHTGNFTAICCDNIAPQ